MGRKEKVFESSNSIINFANTGVALSQSQIIRMVNDLREKYTPLKAQKVIHAYIQDGGRYAEEIKGISKFFNKKNIRNLYIPLEIYGFECEGKYILPVIEQIKVLGNYDPTDDEDDIPKSVIKKTKAKVEREYSDYPDTAIGNFEGIIDELIDGNEIDHTKIVSLFHMEGSDKLIDYVTNREENLEVDYEVSPENYTHIPKRMYNRIMKIMDEILNPESKTNSQVQESVVKKKRVVGVRKVKPRNLIKALENFKYSKTVNPEIGMKSLHPSKVEGSKIAYFYDLVQKKLVFMQATAGMCLTIKGTTVYNVDEGKSFKIAIRNFQKTFGSSDKIPNNKTEMSAIVDKINSKKLQLNTCRSNDNMVILRAF